VPGEPVSVLDADDVGRVAVGAVEEEEPHLFRGRRVEGEVDTSQPKGGAKGIVPSRRELPVRAVRQVVRNLVPPPTESWAPQALLSRGACPGYDTGAGGS
jgi:hypothetical protein